MKLEAVMQGTSYQILSGGMEKEIRQIQYDSRKVKSGDIFICIEGLVTDGHIYAKKACEAGASAILLQKPVPDLPKDTTVLLVEDSRAALAQCAIQFYDSPSEKMKLIGVTGTNGKTTTTYLIQSILACQQSKVGVIGTIENRIGDKILHTERTTPESLDLQALFAEMVTERVTHTVMEVSSHSLALKRVYGCDFDIGIFTNLTQDHLDYHKTMENYRAAKGILFSMCKQAVINMDDPAGAYMLEKAQGKPVITYGIDAKAMLQAKNIHISAKGVTFLLNYMKTDYKVTLQIPGKFSIYNALGAIGACLLLKIPMDAIITGLKQNKGVPGRFQSITSPKGIHAIVDYAHTPDGLENILQTANEFVKGKVITVFGCGGDRDRTKRPMMGEIAGRRSDFCVITSDNPRTEDPEKIIDDIEPGTKKTGCPYVRMTDRKQAIFYAVSIAKPEDLVVVAGKGHENYQIFADKTIHFDDVEILQEAFREENE